MCITWIFATFVPLDEAHNEEDQDEEGDGTHESDKPALGGDVDLSAGHGCTGTERDRGEQDERNCPVKLKSRLVKWWSLFFFMLRLTEAVNTEMEF